MTGFAARPGERLSNLPFLRMLSSGTIDLRSQRDRRSRLVELPNGGARLEWIVRERTGVERPVLLEFDGGSNMIRSDRSFAHWSEPPTSRSRVVVAPDLIAYVAIEQAMRTESVHPFVLVAPMCGQDVHFDWSDPGYWDFRSVTLLCDQLTRPSETLALAIRLGLPRCAVVTPPASASWYEWGMARSLVSYDDFARLESGGIPVLAFRKPHDGAEAARLTGRYRFPDEEDRLCRVTRIEAGRPGADALEVVVRSDRSYCPTTGVGTRGHVFEREGGWRTAAAFIDGAPSRSSASIGEELEGLIRSLVVDAAAARNVAAYVALTFLFAAFEALPVLLVRAGGARKRQTLRRLLMALCHEPLTVARTRAAQMAKIADAGSGVLILESPGPLQGPGGATEVGRFLEAGVYPDASAYPILDKRGGLRSLEVFGPRIVMTNGASFAGLACDVLLAEVGDEIDELESVDVAAAAAFRDDLYHWSMTVFPRMRRAALGAPAARVVALLQNELFGTVVPNSSPMELIHEGAEVGNPKANTERPSETMESVLEACGKGDVSMIQVMLELALRDARGDEFSPERVGRWLSSHATVDRERPVERRRLFGQISRIYPRAAGGYVSSDPTDAFGFCQGRSCDGCRYLPVCDATWPGLQPRKNSL